VGVSQREELYGTFSDVGFAKSVPMFGSDWRFERNIKPEVRNVRQKTSKGDITLDAKERCAPSL
jgi:hypothetical protein